MPDPQDDTPALESVGWKRPLIASLIAIVGLVSEWQITDALTVSGIPLVGVAVLVLLWPIIGQILKRGGEIGIAGLRLKLEQTETINELKLAELEAEIADMRKRLPEDRDTVSIMNKRRPHLALELAVQKYRAFDDIKQYRMRVETDRELIRGARMVPIAVLNDFLENQSHTRDAQMAVAVVLGLPSPPGEELQRAQLLSKLVDIPSERVRSRAARAAQRWGERADTPSEALDMLSRAVRARLRKERQRSGARGYLVKAYEVLSAEQFRIE